MDDKHVVIPGLVLAACAMVATDLHADYGGSPVSWTKRHFDKWFIDMDSSRLHKSFVLAFEKAVVEHVDNLRRLGLVRVVKYVERTKVFYDVVPTARGAELITSLALDVELALVLDANTWGAET